MWRGRLKGCIGYFKFINVEVIPGSVGLMQRAPRTQMKGRPRNVEELLRRVNLEECISVFVLNGYEDIESFKDLREEDLDYLGIKATDIRNKIRAAIRLLHDYDCTADNSHGETDSGGEEDDEDEDEEDEDDSSSGSELGLGGQPQPLPLAGKFPPGMGLPPFAGLPLPPGVASHGVAGPAAYPAQARPSSKARGSNGSNGSRQGRRQGHSRSSSPPAPAPSSAFAAHATPYNIPVTANSPVSVDSYVVARGKGVAVEAAPRAAAPPPILPRTGSSSSSSSARWGGRAALAGTGTGPPSQAPAPCSPGQAPPELAEQQQDGAASPASPASTASSRHGAALDGFLDKDVDAKPKDEVGLPAVNGVHERAGEAAAPGTGLGHAAGGGAHERSERSSDSGVSSSSSQPSSSASSSRDRDVHVRRDRRVLVGPVAAAARQ